MPSLRIVNGKFTNRVRYLQHSVLLSFSQSPKLGLAHSSLMNLKEHMLVALATSYLQDNIRGISREAEMVRQCCGLMMDAYVVAYQDYLQSKKA